MFKIMIVDDESLVRKGIATSINWEKYGIEVVAEAGMGSKHWRSYKINSLISF